MEQAFQIAIDGPVAAGKGTVSRLVAQRLKFLYVDTGAMYRVACLLALRAGISLEDEEKVVSEVKKHKISMHSPTEQEQDGRLSTVLLDNEDVSWKIRTVEVSNGVPIVAAHKGLREELVRQQQEIAKTQSVVMEGRDITFRVLPNAQLKIFLTASDLERARRRYSELLEKGQDVTFDQVHRDLIERDRKDMERDVDPLQIVVGAWVIDTSELNIETVVETIVNKAKSLMQAK